jgi:hypothetical protein
MPGHRTPDREAEDLIAMIGHMLKSAPLGGFVVAVYQAIFDAD